MAFRDLQETLSWLRDQQRLVEIGDELSPLHEVAACLAVASRSLPTAVLFPRVGGFSVPVVGNLAFGREVIAEGMGLGPADLIPAFRQRLEARVPTQEVSSAEAPLLELDATVPGLEAIPILTHYEADSGPYVTAGLVAARDPETGIVGWGVHRMEVRGAEHLGIALLNPPVAEAYHKAKARGERLPVAVVVGVEPVTFLACASKTPANTEKLSLAGSLRGQPVEVVRAPGTGIPVPARAQYLLEGELNPADERSDGPLGEVSGYSQIFPRTPTLRVERISRRKDALYHALLPTGRDADVFFGLVGEATVLGRVRELYPFARDFHFVPTTFGSSLRVRVAPAPREDVRSLLVHLLSLPMVKNAVAVAEDVDCADPVEVEWSLATRCQPNVDSFVLESLRGQPIDPSCSDMFRTAKFGVDATGYERVKGWSRASHPAPAVARAEHVLEAHIAKD